MTKLNSLFAFLCTIFIFSACQKEYSLEDGNPVIPNTGTAEFTFVGAPGSCANPVINGVFQAGVALDTANKISVQVDVSTIGTYTISSSSANGVSFSATGIFTSTGLKNVVFTASGTPAVTGSFNFTLGAGGCTFSVNCIPGAANNADCKECIYLPFCPGSRYEYSDSVFNPLTLDTIVSPRLGNYISDSDTAINGIGYKKVQISDGANISFAYVNCTNGQTTTIAYNVQSTTSGNVLVAIKSIDLKANAAIGASWSDTSAFASGNTFYRKHTIAQKGITRNVLGVSYTDVIKVSVEQTVLYVDPPYGLVPSGVTEYYIAKGVGLIETISYAENPLTNEIYTGYHSVLKSHLIP